MFSRILPTILVAHFMCTSLSARWIRIYNEDRIPVRVATTSTTFLPMGASSASNVFSLIPGVIVRELSLRDVEINDADDVICFMSLDGCRVFERLQQLKSIDSVVIFKRNERNELVCITRPTLFAALSRNLSLFGEGYVRGLTFGFGNIAHSAHPEGLSFDEIGTQAMGTVAGMSTTIVISAAVLTALLSH